MNSKITKLLGTLYPYVMIELETFYSVYLLGLVYTDQIRPAWLQIVAVVLGLIMAYYVARNITLVLRSSIPKV